MYARSYRRKWREIAINFEKYAISQTASVLWMGSTLEYASGCMRCKFLLHIYRCWCIRLKCVCEQRILEQIRKRLVTYPKKGLFQEMRKCDLFPPPECYKHFVNCSIGAREKAFWASSINLLNILDIFYLVIAPAQAIGLLKCKFLNLGSSIVLTARRWFSSILPNRLVISDSNAFFTALTEELLGSKIVQ
nr:unnamed protein product [Callosobruchus chinensis]